MIMSDARGVPVTASGNAELAALDSFVARLLRIDRGAEAILEDARSFPDTPMVQLAAASFCLFGQTRAADDAASGFLAAAAPLLPVATHRERRYHNLLTLWQRQDHLGALVAAEALTTLWPRDLLAAKIAEFLYYVLGQQHEAPRFLAHMQRLAADNAQDPDFLAMLAFAHALCGNLADGRGAAEQALRIEPRNPWAHHCVAHLHLREGDAAGAVRVLEDYLPLWITGGRFAHCHNAWHLALAHLEVLNLDRAREIFHRHVWGFTPDTVFEQVDAIALLWRLELAGADVASLWAPVADRVEAHLAERYMPFLDAHYIYALARAGRTALVTDWLARVAARAGAADEEARRCWTAIGRPLVEAVAAFAQGDAVRAATLLDPVIGQVAAAGGSDAQVGLFRQTYYLSLVRSGRRADALAYWQVLQGDRPPSPLDRYAHGLAQ